MNGLSCKRDLMHFGSWLLMNNPQKCVYKAILLTATNFWYYTLILLEAQFL